MKDVKCDSASTHSSKPRIDARLVGRCPQGTIKIGGKEGRCVLDSGAEVSTIMESFYREHLSVNDVKDTTSWMKISAANGLEVPYMGYIEAEVEVMGQVFQKVGILVVKDPLNAAMLQRKAEVPGIVGSNIMEVDISR